MACLPEPLRGAPPNRQADEAEEVDGMVPALIWYARWFSFRGKLANACKCVRQEGVGPEGSSQPKNSDMQANRPASRHLDRDMYQHVAQCHTKPLAVPNRGLSACNFCWPSLQPVLHLQLSSRLVNRVLRLFAYAAHDLLLLHLDRPCLVCEAVNPPAGMT